MRKRTMGTVMFSGAVFGMANLSSGTPPMQTRESTKALQPDQREQLLTFDKTWWQIEANCHWAKMVSATECEQTFTGIAEQGIPQRGVTVAVPPDSFLGERWQACDLYTKDIFGNPFQVARLWGFGADTKGLKKDMCSWTRAASAGFLEKKQWTIMSIAGISFFSSLVVFDVYLIWRFLHSL